MFFYAGHFEKKPGFFTKRGEDDVVTLKDVSIVHNDKRVSVIFEIWRPKYRGLDFDLNVKIREV
jgi:hypothetical protein